MSHLLLYLWSLSILRKKVSLLRLSCPKVWLIPCFYNLLEVDMIQARLACRSLRCFRIPR